MTSPDQDAVSQMDPSIIPIRFKCTVCNKFLHNPFQLMCCSQPFCESCHEVDRDQCPLCEHKPFSISQTTQPFRKLRTSVKSFIKTQQLNKKKAEAGLRQPESTIRSESQETNGAATEFEEKVGSSQNPPAIVEVQRNSTQESSAEGVQDSKAQSAGKATTEDGVSQSPVATLSNPAVPAKVTNAQSEKLARNPDRPSSVDGMRESMKQRPHNARATSNGYRESQQNQETNGMPNAATMQQMFPMAQTFMNFQMMSGFPPMMQNLLPGPGMAMNGMYGQNWNAAMLNPLPNGNPNAYVNGYGGDSGYNMGRGNFQNGRGDMNFSGRGFGRGRGRVRGGYGRGRGNYQNYQNYQNSNQWNQPMYQNFADQQRVQDMTDIIDSNERSGSKLSNQDPNAPTQEQLDAMRAVEETPDDDFLPGGMEEVKEALGDDYYAKPDSPVDAKPVTPESTAETVEKVREVEPTATEAAQTVEPAAEAIQPENSPAQGKSDNLPDDGATMEKPSNVPGVSDERKAPMAPPSAPAGPSSAREEPEDYGFRARSSGRMTAKSRDSLSATPATPVSPHKAVSQSPSLQSPDSKGVGVVGAPTGPRAMREPPSRHSRTPSNSLSNGAGNSTGFRIVGRASITSQGDVSHVRNESGSAAPVNGSSRKRSRSQSPVRDDARSSRSEKVRHEHQNREFDEFDYGRDPKRRKSGHREHDEYDSQDRRKHRSRSETPEDRKDPSHRSRKEKERSSKHQSSKSKRSHDEMNGDGGYDDDRAAEDDRRDDRHRSSKSRHIETRDREGEKDTLREGRHRHRRERESERDRDGEGEREHEREKVKAQDRHRKRSRNDFEEDAEGVDAESRHRSRRYEKDSQHDQGRDAPVANGQALTTPTNHVSRSRNTSEAATPVSAPQSRPKTATPQPQPSSKEPEKDPYTLEREARIQERMLKEQQRRQNAMHSGQEAGSGRGKTGAGRTVAPVKMMTGNGRRMNVRYEDELPPLGSVENDRSTRRWR